MTRRKRKPAQLDSSLELKDANLGSALRVALATSGLAGLSELAVVQCRDFEGTALVELALSVSLVVDSGVAGVACPVGKRIVRGAVFICAGAILVLVAGLSGERKSEGGKNE